MQRRLHTPILQTWMVYSWHFVWWLISAFSGKIFKDLVKKDIEIGEEDIKPKLRRKPTELDSDDDEDTVDDVKPLKQVFIEMAGAWNEMKQ